MVDKNIIEDLYKKIKMNEDRIKYLLDKYNEDIELVDSNIEWETR